MRPRKYRWWHGVAFYVGVQAAGLVLRAVVGAARGRRPGSAEEDRTFYENLRLPVFAPPGAAFPIVWAINNAAAIAGGLYVLNLPAETEGRREFLRLQAASWVLFAMFNAGYFGLRSPVNAAVLTLAYTGATSASLAVALRQRNGTPAALSLAPTAAWVLLATPVSIAQALWNKDPFWNIGPLADPPPALLKNSKVGQAA